MSKNILFVDDDEDTLEYLEEVLESELQSDGFNFHTAQNLSSAINIIKSNEIDLVICDLILVNEKGTDIFEMMNENDISPKPDTIFLSMASSDMFDDWDAVKKAKAYFDKFNDFNAMLNWVKKRLD